MAVIWKPVPSLAGVLVSEEGQILLPPRYAPLPNGGYRAYFPEPTWGVLTRSDKDAEHVYMGISTRFYGNIKVHRAVCEAFHGAPPFEGAVVIHINEDATHNFASNLRWGTQKENLNAPGFLNYCRSRTGEESPVRKHLRRLAA